MTKAAELAKMGEVLTNSQIGGRRNIILNPKMAIAQRGTSSTGNTTGGYKTVDRFKFDLSNLGTHTFSQSSDAPIGFKSALRIDCTTADASPAAGDVLYCVTGLEGQDLQQLKKGTSSAEKITISFYVKSNKTGTYVFEIYDNDNTKHIASTYTISSADTWEQKTITFAGDTSDGFDNDNGGSMYLFWWIGAGTNYTSGSTPTSWASVTTANRAAGLNVNIADNTANDWAITGVQLEVGEQATPFEHRSFGEELALCQRYYRLIDDGDSTSAFVNCSVYTASKAYGTITLNPPMRTTPSLEQVTGTNYYQILSNGSGHNFDSFVLSSGNSTNRAARFNNNENFSTVTAGHSGWFKTANTSAFVALEAEL
jgi:hypothetical protein